MAKDKRADTGITEADITESIDELESLIAETKLPPKLQGEIPVLNDVVDAAEVRKYAQNEITSNTSEDFPMERMDKLIDTVDKKLSSELDSLVDLLKDTIKDSIVNEVKIQLKNEEAQIKSDPPRIDSPEKPSK